MSTSKELIKTFTEENKSEFMEKCFLIAQDINYGHFTLVQLTEELGELLANPSLSKREKGVLILTEILHSVSSDLLNSEELKYISLFYAEKLNDHHQMLPVVLRGILKLITFTNYPEEAVPTLLNTFFLKVACQQQQQNDRYTIYQIFQLLLEKYKEVLISMELNLVYGVISSIDGERDPRNLLFLFKWLKKFVTVIPLGHLTAEMFEVMECYFPVDFKTPPSSANKITREDLANELCPCLCAIPEFSEYCIPLALEKLDSSLQIAKLDSLNLLKEGCLIFPCSSYINHISEIWSQLQKEIFSDIDDIIKTECLDTLTTIITKISQDGKESLNSVLSNITCTLKGNLLPGSKLFYPSTQILLHTSLASQESSFYIVKEIVPLLTNTFTISHESTQKAEILRGLIEFIKIHLKHCHKNAFPEKNLFEVVSLLCLKASVEGENNLRETGYQALADLVEHLTLDIRLSLYNHLHKIISESEPVHVRDSILKCLQSFSVFYPDEVNNYVLYHSKITSHSVLNLYLDAICVVADIEYFRQIVIENLIEYSLDDTFSNIALKNMSNLLERECNNTQLLNVFLQKQVINKLVQYAVTKINFIDDSFIELLLNVSSILKILIGSQDFAMQNEIVKSQMIIIDGYKNSEELYVLLLEGLISRLCKGLSLDIVVLKLLIKISIVKDNVLIRDVSNQLMANVINKYPDGDNFNEYLDIIKEDCLNYIGNYKCNVIVTLAWITKAVVMRNHHKASRWTDLLMKLLEEDSSVAKGFKIIMNDNYQSLSSTSHCNKMLLYQQKFFVLVTNELSAKFSSEKASYLVAIGYLVEYVPEQALLLQFKKILKLVFMCLGQCNDIEVLCSMLKKIRKFLITNESIFQENLEDFLIRILKLTAYESSMNVRIAALKCLVSFTSFPLYKILPFKQKVLNQLQLCIDDKKRLVRREAMEARALWCLLDAPV